jgi:hypothetical protein
MNYDSLFNVEYNTPLNGKDIEQLKNYFLKKKGWVYIAYSKNDNLLKIGRTGKNPHERAKTLSTTGVMHDYQILFALEVFNQFIAEKNIHRRLKKFRVTTKKEFFSVKPEVAIEAMHLECEHEKKLLTKFLNIELIKEDIDLLEHAIL